MHREIRSEPELAADGAGDDWAAVLDAYGVQYVVLDRQRDKDLVQAIGREPDWQVDFQDRDALLLARRSLPTREGAQSGNV